MERRMNFRRFLIAVTVAVFGLGPPLVIANPSDGILHGAVLAEVNKHGNLVIAVDRFTGPAQPENGIADVIFVFAAEDDAALSEVATRISSVVSRLNLDYARGGGWAELRINVPSQANFRLVTEQLESDVTGRDPHRADGIAPVRGLALSRTEVREKSWSLADAMGHFRDFSIVPDFATDEAVASSDTSCIAGGWCSSSCAIAIGGLSCEVTCYGISQYSCCNLTGCRCKSKSGQGDPP